MRSSFGQATGLVLLLLGLIAVAGCRDHAAAGPVPRDAAAALPDAGADASATSVTPPARLPPLRGEWMETLELPGGGLAYVTPPVGATEPRPVIVAIHGAVDDPGLICSAWRLVADVYPFVVCPAGTKLKQGAYVWRSSDQIDARMNEALAALTARYGDHVARTPVIYAAFSQGANMAAPVLKKNAKRVPRAVLTEGGYRAFDAPGSAAAFANDGGERVMFSCSQPGCSRAGGSSRAALSRAGVAVRVVDSGPHGHSMPPPVRESLNAALPWLVDGLEGWEGWRTAPKLDSH